MLIDEIEREVCTVREDTSSWSGNTFWIVEGHDATKPVLVEVCSNPQHATVLQEAIRATVRRAIFLYRERTKGDG